MNKNKTKISFLFSLFTFFMLFATNLAAASIKGIYLTQYTLENTSYLSNLIKNAKAAGINTFVVDLTKPNQRYRENIKLVKENGIHYVARIVMFPGGGTREQVKNKAYWQSKYALIEQAITFGADGIQLDYIRYNTKQKPSSQNAKDIHEIIQWYKNKLAAQRIPLEVDVFGVASFGEAKYIGHNVKLFGPTVDAMCPMVYPSHYEPAAKHYKTPYETVFDSLMAIKEQFAEERPFKLYPYIELSNYHYSMSRAERLAYIKAQLRAVDDADADGWYAWSPHNRYENLFYVLQNGK